MIIINNKPLVIANRLNNKHLYKTNISEEKVFSIYLETKMRIIKNRNDSIVKNNKLILGCFILSRQLIAIYPSTKKKNNLNAGNKPKKQLSGVSMTKPIHDKIKDTRRNAPPPISILKRFSISKTKQKSKIMRPNTKDGYCHTKEYDS